MATIFTGISLFSLIAVSFWCTFEKSVFIHHKGQRLLADVIANFYTNWTEHTLHDFTQRLHGWCSSQASHVVQGGSKVLKGSWRIWSTLVTSKSKHTNDSEGKLPVSNTNSTPSFHNVTPRAVTYTMQDHTHPTS
jgi:hypothetical protein